MKNQVALCIMGPFNQSSVTVGVSGIGSGNETGWDWTFNRIGPSERVEPLNCVGGKETPFLINLVGHEHSIPKVLCMILSEIADMRSVGKIG